MKKKHSIFIGVFAVVAILCIVALRHFSSDANTATAGGLGARDRVIPVEVQDVSFRSMTQLREFTGAINASYTYIISANIPGRLLSVNRRIGDRVRANEIIGRIDDTDFRNAFEEAQAQVAVSKASLSEANTQLAHSESELRRARDLLSRGIISQAEYDVINTQVEMQRSRRANAAATLRQREIALSQAQTNLEHTRIRATKDGFVALRHVDGGTLLSRGSQILTVVGIDTVFVELAVTERDYQSIRRGKRATVTAAAVAGHSFEGEVYRVAPFFQAASRTAAVEVALRNENHLLMPGMSARIQIVLQSDDNAQALPVSAVVESRGRHSIFVVDGEIARSVEVEIGITDGRFVQIVYPKTIDGQVVVLGQHLLRDGARVSITNAGNQ